MASIDTIWSGGNPPQFSTVSFRLNRWNIGLGVGMATPDARNTTPRIINILEAMRPQFRGGIHADTRIFGDLGMDSLDFTSLLFHLEKEFDMAIDSSQLESLASMRVIPQEDLVDGYLSEAWLDRVRPMLAGQALPERVRPSDMLDTVTVAMVVRMVERSQDTNVAP